MDEQQQQQHIYIWNGRVGGGPSVSQFDCMLVNKVKGQAIL